MKTRVLLAAALTFAAWRAAGAPSPSMHQTTYDPVRELHGRIAGPPTSVMVLGSLHLKNLGEGFRPAVLGPLLDRLAAFRPTVITVEALTGTQCDQLARFSAVYASDESYCRLIGQAEQASGMALPDAASGVVTTLAHWPNSPTPGDRRRLAALFMGSGERASALVQWLRLPPSERRDGDGLNAELVRLLRTMAEEPNENAQIAAVLAARLKLDRVYPVDDHTADIVERPLGEPAGRAIHQIWDQPNPVQQKFAVMPNDTGAAMLDVYRFANGAEYQRSVSEGEFGPLLRQSTPELYGRQYVAWWQTRNLRIVSNIVAAAGNTPGARVLAIIGASHAAYLRSYFGQMNDYDVVDPEQILH